MKHSIVLIALVLCSSHCLSQASAAAVPFVLIAPSPEANGMGGISACVPGSDPFAPIANPGQLGTQMLSQNFLAGAYVPKTQWLPGFGISSLSYRADAVSAGLNLHDVIPMPFDVSFGLGYSSVYLDYGEFAMTGNDPTASQTYHAWEESRAFSFGVGLDFVVKLGVGFNVKKIESNLAPFGTQDRKPAAAKVTATDFGAIATVPFTRFLPLVTKIIPGIDPILDLNISYTRNNVGDEVRYDDYPQADPLPRLATVGMSLELGAVSHLSGREWKMVSFTLARQSEDVLVSRSATGAIEYGSGIGGISPFKNLVLSQRSDGADLRKGFQLSVLELFYYRSGSADGPDVTPASTSGIGFRLYGVWHILRALDRSIGQDGIFGFLMDHVDVSYNTSEYSHPGSPVDKTKFSGLSVILR